MNIIGTIPYPKERILGWEDETANYPSTPSATPSVWLDANDPSTLNLTGLDVDSWEDKGSLGLTFTAGANKFTADGQINGRNCIQWNTLAVAYLESALSPAFTGTLVTAYAVILPAAAMITNSVRTLLSMAVDNATTDTGNINASSILAKTNASVPAAGGYRNNLDVGRYTMTAGEPLVMATRFDNAFGRSYKNNVIGSQLPALVGAFNTGHLRVGNRPTGAATHQIFGSIGEILLYLNATHDNATLLHNYQYLANKWGII